MATAGKTQWDRGTKNAVLTDAEVVLTVNRKGELAIIASSECPDKDAPRYRDPRVVLDKALADGRPLNRSSFYCADGLTWSDAGKSGVVLCFKNYFWRPQVAVLPEVKTVVKATVKREYL